MPADLGFALKDDCRVFDNPETVTLLSKSESDGDARFTVRFAQNKSISDLEIANSGGYLGKGDMTWVLFDKYLESSDPKRKPKVGDSVIQGNGQEWKIMAANLDQLDQAWDCQSTRAK